MENKDKIDFSPANAVDSSEQDYLDASDFLGGSFVKNPLVGEAVLLDVIGVKPNKNITAVNKITNKEFNIGLKNKKGEWK